MKPELVKWSERYSTGIESVDIEHKMLFNYLNEFFEAFLENKADSRIEKLLDKLSNYAKDHFHNEESYMRKNGYPDIQSHILEHNKFRKKITEFKSDYHEGKVKITHGLLTYMSNWLVNHILFTDKRFVNYTSDDF
jgi:hemerythrin-like metal-binding protein